MIYHIYMDHCPSIMDMKLTIFRPICRPYFTRAKYKEKFLCLGGSENESESEIENLQGKLTIG